MKGIIVATLAIFLVSGMNLPSNAKSAHGTKANKKQIALTLQGGAAKDTVVDPKAPKVGVGSDFTSEWSGGYADTINVGSGLGGG